MSHLGGFVKDDPRVLDVTMMFIEPGEGYPQSVQLSNGLQHKSTQYRQQIAQGSDYQSGELCTMHGLLHFAPQIPGKRSSQSLSWRSD